MRVRYISIIASVVALGLFSAVTQGTAADQAKLPAPVSAFAALDTPAAAGSAEPNLVSDRRGRVWLTWLEPRPGGGHRFRLASLAGKAWSAPATIAEGPGFLANWADFPSVYVAADGTMAAHWLDRGAGQPYGIRVSTSRDSGRTWTPAASPHQNSTAGEYGFVSFYDAPGGGVGMVWLDGREMAGGHGGEHKGSMTLRSTILRKGSATEELVIDSRVCECCQTSAANADGAVLVVYRDRSDKEVRDTSIARFVNGAWSQPVTVHADNWEINGCPVNGPAVAATGRAAAVAWFTGAGNTPKTQVAFSADAGLTFGPPIRFDTATTLGRLDLLMPSPDRVLVSSLERAEKGARVVLRDVRRDGRTSDPVEVTLTTPDRSGGFARMALSGSRLVVAWTEITQARSSNVRTAVAEVR